MPYIRSITATLVVLLIVTFYFAGNSHSAPGPAAQSALVPLFRDTRAPLNIRLSFLIMNLW